MKVRIEQWSIYRAASDDEVVRWAVVHTTPSGNPVLLAQKDTRREAERIARQRGYEIERE